VRLPDVDTGRLSGLKYKLYSITNFTIILLLLLLLLLILLLLLLLRIITYFMAQPSNEGFFI
jgi:hypothetical protein